MIVQLVDIRFCVDKAEEIVEHYLHYVLSGEYPRSVDDLLYICEQYLQLKINWSFLPIPAQSSSIRGFYLSNHTHADIFLLSGMNPCWNRFVLCKELFHVLLEKEDNRSIRIFDHLSEVAMKFPEPDSHPSASAVSELLAELAAMQFLFPYSERVLIKKNAESSGVSLDFLKIAHEYKIPQVYVERYLSEPWMAYMRALLVK